MKRKQLLSLPVIPPESESAYPDIEKIKKTTLYGTKYIMKIRHYTYKAFWDQSTGESILIVDIFSSGTKKHLFRSFTEKDGNFYGYNAEKKKESSAGMDYILNYYETSYHADGESDQEIRKLTGRSLEKETNGKIAIKELAEYHRKVKEKRLQERYRKIKEAISLEMLEIRDLPVSVHRWIDSSLMKKSRYLFYEYNGKKKTTGYCTYCKQTVTVEGAKREKKGKCPSCGCEITFLPRRKWEITAGFSDYENFCYFQPTKKGYCVRFFRVTKEFRNPDKLGDTHLHEFTRIFYEEKYSYFEPVSRYNWEQFRQTGTYCFNPSCYGLNERIVTVIYPSNLNRILRTEDPKRKYIDFSEIARKCGKINYRHISDYPAGYRQIEYLMKLKLYRLVASIINDDIGIEIDFSQNNIKKALGIGKEDIPILQKTNADFRYLKAYKMIKAAEGKVNPEDIKWILENISDFKYMAQVLRYSTLHKAIRYLELQGKKVGKRWWKSPADNALSLWKDYLKDMAILEMDLKNTFILFPADLKKAHDEAYQEAERVVKEQGSHQIEKMEQELNRLFGFENKKFLLRAPKSGKEIRDEGAALHHCVGRYVESMARRDTIILFVRKKEKPKIPYYTVELNPDTWEIIQYRGYGNNVSKEHPVDPDVTKFLETWKVKCLSEEKRGNVLKQQRITA